MRESPEASFGSNTIAEKTHGIWSFFCVFSQRGWKGLRATDDGCRLDIVVAWK
jgi:hypothetical protein